MVDVIQLGYEVDSSQVKKGDQALDGLTKQTINAHRASANLSKSAANLNGVIGRNSNRLRQVSLQMSQVAQSTSATGQFTRSLALQLPDIGLAFGTVGIAAGVVAGALLPVIANLGGTADTSREAEKAMKELSSSIGFVKSELKVVRDLQASYSSAVVRGQDSIAASLMQEIQLRGDLLKFRRLEAEQQLASVQESVATSRAAFENVLSQARNAAATIERDLVNQQFVRTQAQESALNAIQNVLDQNKSVTLEYKKQQAEADLLTLQIERIDSLLDSAAGGASNLANGLANAAAEASKAALSAQQIFDRTNKQYSGRGGDPRAQGNEDSIVNDTARRVGRGASRPDMFGQNLNLLVQSLETERETVDRWYQENQTILMDRRAMEILGEQEHAEALLRIRQEYQDRVNAINVAGGNTMLSQTSTIFGSLESLAIANGRSTARAAATFGAIKATINAYEGATEALKLPFPKNLAAYATVLSTGLGAAASIRSAGSAVGAGGGGGLPSGASGVSAAGPEREQPKRVLVDFTGSPDWVSAMFADITQRIQEDSDLGVIYEVAR